MYDGEYRGGGRAFEGADGDVDGVEWEGSEYRLDDSVSEEGLELVIYVLGKAEALEYLDESVVVYVVKEALDVDLEGCTTFALGVYHGDVVYEGECYGTLRCMRKLRDKSASRD